ncbi:MAG: hypothetical protein L0241_11820 [Planctomycetia bacterium]|nr:hypothetical protein [Planctomycetia bacterium]
MDEAQWLECQYSYRMIWTLFSRSTGQGKIKDERFRRFGIACARRVLAALPGGQSVALDNLEAWIDSPTRNGLADARKLHLSTLKTHPTDAPFGALARRFASQAILRCARSKPTQAAMASSDAATAMVEIKAVEGGWTAKTNPNDKKRYSSELAEIAVHAAIVRDIFGNPFRPVAFSSEWRTDTAIALARQMWESREFSAMPILADALQDAGCDNEVILNHCRDANQPHVRGCWVVDLVLGKS